MSLKTYILGMAMDDRHAFADRCGTTYGHLRNVAYGKSCDQDLALAIERETGGLVTVAELRPRFAELLEACHYRRVEPLKEAA